MPNTPDQPVRDFVLPIGIVKRSENGDGIELVKFLGTGFLVGNEGFLVTAAHVIKPKLADGEALAAMLVQEDTSWTAHFFTYRKTFESRYCNIKNV